MCRRAVASIVAFVLLTAACGGGESEGERLLPSERGETAVGDVVVEPRIGVDELTEADLDPELFALADQLIATFGSAEAAGVAMLRAADRGVDPAAIVAAAVDGSLQPDGAIEPQGFRRAVDPEDPSRVFASLAMLAGETPDVERDAGRWALVIFIALARAGYTKDQIVEHLLTAEGRVFVPPAGTCAQIELTPVTFDEFGDPVDLGEVLAPAGAPLDECVNGTDIETTDEANDAATSAEGTAPDQTTGGNDGDVSIEVDAATYRIDPDPRTLNGEVFSRAVGGTFDAEPVAGGVRIAGTARFEDVLVVSEDGIQCTVTYEFGFDTALELDGQGATVAAFIQTPTPIGLEYDGPLCGDPVYQNSAVEYQGEVASQALPLVLSATVENGTLVGSFAQPDLDFTDIDDVTVAPIGNLVRTS